MKFSLIVCTYMRPEPLLKLLKSVQEQLLYPDQIIIVDGSTNDETLGMLGANSFKNLEYFKVSDEERGLTKQRNFGIEKVLDSMDIVCFLDDDIVLTQTYFKTLIETYAVFPNALGVGGYISNEVDWRLLNPSEGTQIDQFVYDGWVRKDGSRFVLRKKLGLDADRKPAHLPDFAHGRSVSFLPPSGKTYKVEQFMGGVASYKKEVLDLHKFSEYFEGYGLYEDADFTLRLSKMGELYVNTAAQLSHFHEASGRPNQYSYGKMVVRNGWYVWRVRHPKPSFKARIKWNATAFLLTLIRFLNAVTSNEKKKAFTEAMGRTAGWLSLIFNKPRIE
ncbi:glycosyltransferase family 2 protein [Ulvibacter antarcticus]|uniref:GT2 family glycosyltransferase n=1 Tax=Ulvibacter antarcticus TaxID=442714 RepID=A0A3L9YF64_9FLAO|nr:glycosyltransferase [Ulvibacter antarcticus]RMA57990.1 GT2 family glycosyltransferase [Ulvibacter antarcticus]